MSIKVMAAISPEALDTVFKLRHEVFVEQGAYFAPREDKRLVDRFDAFDTSVNFMAFVDDIPIGALRLTINSCVGIPADDFYNFHQHIPIEETLVISVGQFCIKDKYRGNLPILNSLMMMAFYWAISKQGTHIVAPFNPPLQALMRRCGFKKVSEIIDVHGVNILPMAIDLKKVRDSFTIFSQKQNIVFFMENFFRQYFVAGETIIKQNEQGDAAYFIVEGKAKVVIGDMDKPETLKTVNHLNKGELFGEIALLCDSDRTANVIAEEDTQVMVLERNIFLAQVKKDPEKLQFILDLLGKRFANMTRHL
ncbi:MAG: cyclic nucleotide-binding domain-containing protein [Methylococcaceae bacterium]|nr:cyclic nucleotide-binding domain-containing protein [Methylococcaceae bacterium]